MHSAPAVSYPVGRSRLQAGLLATVLAAGASSLVVWTMQSDPPGWRHLVAAGLWLVTASVATWAWSRTPAGLLTWDGKAWNWTVGEHTRQGTLNTILDSQSALLLHVCTPGAPPLWLWPERQTAPIRWLALRRAVFARQSAESTLATDGIAP